jgi:hypothetical protein
VRTTQLKGGQVYGNQQVLRVVALTGCPFGAGDPDKIAALVVLHALPAVGGQLIYQVVSCLLIAAPDAVAVGVIGKALAQSRYG